MALFTDGSVSSIEDLTAQDSQLLGVANVEGIDLTRKLAVAQDEIGVEVENLLGRMRYGTSAMWARSSATLDNVVVTPALRLWHTFRTLEAFYRDAFNSQLNDRYAGRRDEFHKMAKSAYDLVIEGGIGMASDPVRQAEIPQLVAAPGAVAVGIYYVAMAWVNSAGEIGASSIPAVIEILTGSFDVRPGVPAAHAVSWNVYAGGGPDALVRQNDSPIQPATVWRQPNVLVTTGPLAGLGQAPTYLQPVPRLLQRG